MTVADFYEALDTALDPCSTLWDNIAASGGAFAGVVLPGGGYGRGAKKLDDLVEAGARAGRRTEPLNLAEKLALDEAAGGAGRRIMKGRIKDPDFPEDVWAKIEHVHKHPDGSQSVIHYWENLQTGSREGFKFK
jgi:hypothetical protein